MATAEVAGRKSRLGSVAISVDKYPRIVFGVEVSLDRVFDPWETIIAQGPPRADSTLVGQGLPLRFDGSWKGT